MLTSDSFVGNADWAVYYDVTPDEFGQDSNLSGAGNGHDAVGFVGGSVSGSWSTVNLGLPLVLAGDATVNAGATLSLASGSALHMIGNLYVAGNLNMVGTATAPISLTTASVTPTVGQWGSLYFRPGSDGNLSYVHLSYGGSGAFGAIVVEGSGPVISNSIIDNSGSSDVGVTGGDHPILHNDVFGAVPSNYSGVATTWAPGQPRINATYNWWGDPSGPSGSGLGAGVPVGNGVNILPWLTSNAAAGAL